MNEWWLLSILFILVFFSSIVMIYPLRSHRVVSIFLVFIIFVLACTGYYNWGGFLPWHEYMHQKQSKALAQQLLKSIKSPEELIDKLKAKLYAHPDSAKGWYLLGRLYTSQNEEQNALNAFAKAYYLNPKEEQFAVHYAHSLWQLNKQQFNPEILGVFQSLLKNNPKQPDALAMLAMNAFLSHDYDGAINYWQRLLELAPEQSEEAMAIRKAIAKAQEQMTQGGHSHD